jgi:hypothetical protein
VSGISYESGCTATPISATVADSPDNTRVGFAWRVQLVISGPTQSSHASQTSSGSIASTQSTGSAPTTGASSTQTKGASGTHPSNSPGGLSKGSKIAIGVVVPIVVVLILLVFVVFLRRNRRKEEQEQEAKNLDATPDAAPDKPELEASLGTGISGVQGRAYQKPELETTETPVLGKQSRLPLTTSKLQEYANPDPASHTGAAK